MTAPVALPPLPAPPAPAPDVAPTVVVVAPGAVPPGATVVGLVVVLPPVRPASGLHAVPADLVVVDDDAPTGPGPGDPPAHEWLRAGLSLDRAGRAVTMDGGPLELTRREFDLLAHLASRPGRVLTREHLLSTVWGHDDPRWAGPRTVDVHVARLRRKLAGHGRCVQTVRGVGYRWKP
jgi:hypothetical protein